MEHLLRLCNIELIQGLRQLLPPFLRRYSVTHPGAVAPALLLAVGAVAIPLTLALFAVAPSSSGVVSQVVFLGGVATMLPSALGVRFSNLFAPGRPNPAGLTPNGSKLRYLIQTVAVPTVLLLWLTVVAVGTSVAVGQLRQGTNDKFWPGPVAAFVAVTLIPAASAIGVLVGELMNRRSAMERLRFWLLCILPLLIAVWGLSTRIASGRLIPSGMPRLAGDPHWPVLIAVCATIGGASTMFLARWHPSSRRSAIESARRTTGIVAPWFAASSAILDRKPGITAYDAIRQASITAPYVGLLAALTPMYIDDERLSFLVLQYAVVGALYFVNDVPLLLSTALDQSLRVLIAPAASVGTLLESRTLWQVRVLSSTGMVLSVALGLVSGSPLLLLPRLAVVAATTSAILSAIAQVCSLCGIDRSTPETVGIAFVLTLVVPLSSALGELPLVAAYVTAGSIAIVTYRFTPGLTNKIYRFVDRRRYLPLKGARENLSSS